jgi:hypothetical protein
MRQHHALFANFILRFGERELIDYAKTILIPALTNSGQVRKHGQRTAYSIFKGRVVRLDENEAVPVMAIIGQFVKQTELVRYQIFKRTEGPVADEATLSSAPSAFFALLLNNHRLIYFPETPDAPDLTSFKATVKKFILNRYHDYIDECHGAAQDAGEPITKVQLRKDHKAPTLEIIPLTGKDTIAAFINQFQVLKTIDFRIVKPNSEIDGHPIFRQLREASDRLGSTDTRLRTTNPDGLDKNESRKTIIDATDQGNQEVSLSGIDQQGNKLTGNNESFKISAPLGKVPVAKLTLAKRLYGIFHDLVTKNVIKVESPNERVIATVEGLQ